MRPSTIALLRRCRPSVGEKEGIRRGAAPIQGTPATNASTTSGTATTAATAAAATASSVAGHAAFHPTRAWLSKSSSRQQQKQQQQQQQEEASSSSVSPSLHLPKAAHQLASIQSPLLHPPPLPASAAPAQRLVAPLIAMSNTGSNTSTATSGTSAGDALSANASPASSSLFAVVYINNLQYKVAPGDTIIVQRLAGVALGSTIALKKVLMVGGARFTALGRPLLKGATVSAVVEEHKRMKSVLSVTPHKGMHLTTFKDRQHAASVVRILGVEYHPVVVGELDKDSGVLMPPPPPQPPDGQDGTKKKKQQEKKEMEQASATTSTSGAVGVSRDASRSNINAIPRNVYAWEEAPENTGL